MFKSSIQKSLKLPAHVLKLLLKAEDLPDVEEEADADEKLPDGSLAPGEGRKKTKSRKGKKKTGPRKRKILLTKMR